MSVAGVGSPVSSPVFQLGKYKKIKLEQFSIENTDIKLSSDGMLPLSLDRDFLNGIKLKNVRRKILDKTGETLSDKHLIALKRFVSLCQQHQTTLRTNSPNAYGYVELIVDKKNGKVKCYIDPTGKLPSRMQIGEAGLVNGPRGSFWQLVCKTDRWVTLYWISPGSTPAQPEVSPNHYRELKTIVPSILVGPDKAIARNAGLSLLDWTKKPTSSADDELKLNDFKPLLTDIDALHKKNIFHLDIKQENLTVSENKFGLRTIKMIDCDGLCYATPRNSFVFTPMYLPSDLENAIKKGEKQAYLIADTYQILCSMIESMVLTSETLDNLKKNQFVKRINIFRCCGQLAPPFYSYMLDRTDEGTGAQLIESWLTQYIKPEHVEHVRNLLKDPVQYRNTWPDQLLLSDLFNASSG